MITAILMSTYNGERYIREQIDSILAQRNVDIKLFIRDDGSSDSTVEIINEYAAENDNVVFINKDDIKNVGVMKSFMTLLQYAYQQPAIDYFAFADQDDFWLPDKIIAAVTMLEQQENNEHGKLYYSNKTFVDSKLNFISQENIVFYNDFYEIFWRNFASGCTMVFDRVLSDYALKSFPEYKLFIHDNWTYRVAKMISAVIVFDTESYMLYRQHGKNVVGADNFLFYQKDIFSMFEIFKSMLFQKREHKGLMMFEELYQTYNAYANDENRKISNLILNYKFNPVNKFRLIFNNDMNKRDWKTRVIWAGKILFNFF